MDCVCGRNCVFNDSSDMELSLPCTFFFNQPVITLRPELAEAVSEGLRLFLIEHS